VQIFSADERRRSYLRRARKQNHARKYTIYTAEGGEGIWCRFFRLTSDGIVTYTEQKRNHARKYTIYTAGDGEGIWCRFFRLTSDGVVTYVEQKRNHARKYTIYTAGGGEGIWCRFFRLTSDGVVTYVERGNGKICPNTPPALDNSYSDNTLYSFDLRDYIFGNLNTYLNYCISKVAL